MNKYVFPGADASCSLGWVVSQVEAAGFEVREIDVFGVHYSATIWRWYKNWLANKDKVVEKYGERYVLPSRYSARRRRSLTHGIRWYRIWVYFLASAVIISRYVASLGRRLFR